MIHPYCSPLKGKTQPLDVFSSFGFLFFSGLDKLTQGHGLLQVCFTSFHLLTPKMAWTWQGDNSCDVTYLFKIFYGKSTSSVNLKSRFLSSLLCVVGWQSLWLLLWIFQFSRKRCSISGRPCATLIIASFVAKAAEHNPWFFVIAIFRFPVQKAKEGFI